MEEVVWTIFAKAGESLKFAEMVMLWLALVPAMFGVLFAMMSEWELDCTWEDVQVAEEFEEWFISDEAIQRAAWGDVYDNNPGGGLCERLWDDSDRWLYKARLVELVI